MQFANGGMNNASVYYNLKRLGIETSEVSQSLEFASGQYPLEPIGKREKARPEVTQLIERQKSRLNSSTRKGSQQIETSHL